MFDWDRFDADDFMGSLSLDLNLGAVARGELDRGYVLSTRQEGEPRPVPPVAPSRAPSATSAHGPGLGVSGSGQELGAREAVGSGDEEASVPTVEIAGGGKGDVGDGGGAGDDELMDGKGPKSTIFLRFSLHVCPDSDSDDGDDVGNGAMDSVLLTARPASEI